MLAPRELCYGTQPYIRSGMRLGCLLYAGTQSLWRIIAIVRQSRISLRTRLTIEDFETLPDALAHNHELVDGELIDVLVPHVREHKIGKVIAEQEYAFGEDAHGPDITFL